MRLRRGGIVRCIRNIPNLLVHPHPPAKSITKSVEMMILPELVALLTALLSLGLFLAGLVLAIFELCSVGPAVFVVGLGLVGLFASWAIWLLAPNLSLLFGALVHKQRDANGSHHRERGAPPASVLFYHQAGVGKERGKKGGVGGDVILGPSYDVNVDTTETLMRSIRGIPYLIQAIQYSLETTLMSEMHGQSAANASVIHTAPGCHSVLDCDPEEENNTCCSTGGAGGGSGSLTVAKSTSPRTSGPEEQWEEGTSSSRRNLWVNQQLKLSMMNRAYNSSLAVFPYSESRPIDKSESLEDPALNATSTSSASERNDGEAENNTTLHHSGGSMQSTLSRVTVAHHMDNNSQHEIRCIGMSSVFLSRFNNSFRT